MRPTLALSTFALGFGLVVFAGSASAAETVDIVLWDNPEMTMAMNMGVGMAGDHDIAAMGITATPLVVKAGEVTFNVRNDSTRMEHEMVVIPLQSADTAPPYDTAALAIDEDAAGALGEVEELPPGEAGTVSLFLEPGIYLLVCNLPGHYAAGMWTILTVEP